MFLHRATPRTREATLPIPLMSPACINRRALNGFTLIELLTVIAIIGVLAAIIIPTVGKVRATARNAQCVSRLRDWGRAVHLYANDNKGRYQCENWFSAASNPYQPYFPKGINADAIKFFGSCPLISQDLGNPQPSYAMVWPSINGDINQVIPDVPSSNNVFVPLNRAANLSKFLMMCDTMKGSSTRLSGTDASLGSSSSGFKDLVEPLFGAAPVNPGTRGDEVVSRRHGGAKINGVFGDGSVRPVNGAPASSGDANSIYAMRKTWFQLY